MPKIQQWAKFPEALRRHLIERMSDRSIILTDLNQLRLWVETNPEVPEGDWYKDFGSFKLCGEGTYPKTFLLPGQPARGTKL
jgi:hypothetical protein